MRILRLIGLTIAQIAKQVWGLPRSFAAGKKLRQQRAALDAAEAERLDRIRCPSKYLGK